MEGRRDSSNKPAGPVLMGQFLSRPAIIAIFFLALLGARSIIAQSSQPGSAETASAAEARVAVVRVDATPGHATNSFTPDRALGSSIDVLPAGDVDKVYTEPILKESLSAGWGPITYRNNTELRIAAWHWNLNGTWSNAARKSGYFTGSSAPAEILRHSYAYPLPHRGHTRNGGAESGYSRMTDGDSSTYWKSNPYLTRKFTGEDDSLHPQWVVIDLGAPEDVSVVRIDWADPYARKYDVQYWTGEDAMVKPTAGVWNLFPGGMVKDGQGGAVMLKLAESPIRTKYVRIWMTESSNTCDTHGPDDPRNCVGYAIRELSIGNFSDGSEFVDLVKHTPDQGQTATYCSSIDPWHSESDLNLRAGDHTGFDLFYTSGITNNLPAMIPVALLYGTPEDSAAQIAYLKKRGYPISYVEMGEEPDGQNILPEDYAALYSQWATAIHHVDSSLKLGGPIFEGVNEDIKVWPDEQGQTSWLGRFLDYLKSHNRISDLAFMSFEHYPFPPCGVTWSDLYKEPQLVSHILQVWRDDGLPENVPMFITESNLSWGLTQPMADIFAALWLADNAGAFLNAGGAAFYHSPIQPEALRSGCRGWSTYGNFVADSNFQIKAHMSQYYASRLINLEWVKHGEGLHRMFPAACDVKDAAGHVLVTAYAVQRPDGEWSLMLVNRDQSNSHAVRVVFDDSTGKPGKSFTAPVSMVTFGSEQYLWHSDGPNSHPDPDSPPVASTISAGADISFTLPKASITVLRGKVPGLTN
jgi:hypothetical protein